VDLKLVPVANGTGIATVHVEPATCLTAFIQGMLVQGFSSTCLGMSFHINRSITKGQTVPVSLM
jgi:hypothetical protein